MNQPLHPMEHVVWAAGPPSSAPTWIGLHDRVMGGRSEGNAQPNVGDGLEPDHVRFAGHVSTENGGGFASFRLRLPTPVALASATAAVVTLRGDGGPFKLCLHRQSDGDGVQWQADLATTRHWRTQALPLAAFVARRRGRELREHPLSPQDLLFQIGLMVARPDAGPFWLAVARVALR